MNRSGALAQAAYAWPALAVCAATGALASAVVAGARIVALGRLGAARRAGRG
ncbi:hypothetical protein [Streptomyces sp. NRRL F-4489]|uniref:hypothetical protein n=1 Tax=Streptomyces sp. NRRL F-4489 TaxID=1609095 RepID=UPI00131C8A11|nr:hypothetical protein [Streptomyces sp. NRRL F-4489]